MTLKNKPQPTGDIWNPDDKNPATVPISTKLVMSNIKGPFRERERKLWAFLVHAVWDDLETKRVHKIPISSVNKVFRKLGGDHNKNWLKNYLYSIAQTTAVFEKDDEKETIWRTTNLISSADIKKDKETGEELLIFEIPHSMTTMLKENYLFTRLRPHLMISLSGKYAVTLYEVLESTINKKNSIFECSIEESRTLLKVAEGKLKTWYDYHKRAIKPAVKELNKYSEQTGFIVSYELIKGSRNKVERIKFITKKLNSRREFEEKISKKNKIVEISNRKSIPPFNGADYEKVKNILMGTGLDIYALESEWRQEYEPTADVIQSPIAHFITFAKHRAGIKEKKKTNKMLNWLVKKASN